MDSEVSESVQEVIRHPILNKRIPRMEPSPAAATAPRSPRRERSSGTRGRRQTLTRRGGQARPEALDGGDEDQ
eukprot:9658541-Alexandrium_andersonii.AAC.1